MLVVKAIRGPQMQPGHDVLASYIFCALLTNLSTQTYREQLHANLRAESFLQSASFCRFSISLGFLARSGHKQMRTYKRW
jgi:hypothetical protein